MLVLKNVVQVKICLQVPWPWLWVVIDRRQKALSSRFVAGLFCRAPEGRARRTDRSQKSERSSEFLLHSAMHLDGLGDTEFRLQE